MDEEVPSGQDQSDPSVDEATTNESPLTPEQERVSRLLTNLVGLEAILDYEEALHAQSIKRTNGMRQKIAELKAELKQSNN